MLFPYKNKNHIINGDLQAAMLVQQAATLPSYVRCADYAVAFYDAAKAA